LDVLLHQPWTIRLDRGNGFPFHQPTDLLVPNAAAYIAQKILIHGKRRPDERARDVLYIHDTIEVFSGNLEELREIFATQIRSRLPQKKVRELTSAADVLFGAVNDMIRESVRMATGRRLNAEAMIESCRAGLKEIFEQT
jgi:hypothetical protein